MDITSHVCAKKRESEREGREGQEIGMERGGEMGQEMRWGERGY